MKSHNQDIHKLNIFLSNPSPNMDITGGLSSNLTTTSNLSPFMTTAPTHSAEMPTGNTIFLQQKVAVGSLKLRTNPNSHSFTGNLLGVLFGEYALKLASIVLLLVFLSLSANAQGIERIDLNTSMITNETENGDARLLVDEQEFAGDPLNDIGGVPTTIWFPGWSPFSHPASAYIDLGKQFELKYIYLFDVNNKGELTIEYGYPGNWQTLFTDGLESYLQWNQHETDITTRYVRITRESTASNISEILLYGSEAGETSDDDKSPAQITDLQVKQTTATTATLEWTAVGDDANEGTAKKYDVRYSLFPITNDNFNNSMSFAQNVQPSDAGEKQSMTVLNLIEGTEYHFAIKAIDEAFNVSPMSNVATGKTLGENGYFGKIEMTNAVAINEVGEGDANKLIDEQDIAGDPFNDFGGEPETVWFPGWSADLYPASVYLDLGKIYELEEIFLFDTHDVGDVSIEYGAPGSWIALTDEDLGSYLQWKQHSVNVSTRYLRFTRASSKSNFSEVVLYGRIGGDNGGDGEINIDTKAPAAIANLEASDIGETALTLNWSATGDDDTEGTASSYEIRYSAEEITAANFNNAMEVSQNLIPKLAGQSESIEVNELQPDTRYYFALKAMDEVPNASAISNIATANTRPEQEETDAIMPAAIADLDAIDITETTLTLTWRATGDDGIEGTAAAYEIRYSTSMIDAANFADAMELSQNLVPQLAGQMESIEVNELEPNTTYYFALKAMDEMPNVSDLSNVLETTTRPQEEETDAIAPTAITDLNITEIGETNLWLNWTATGDDGSEGIAKSYEIRYSVSPITAANFANAIVINNPITPLEAGSFQGMEVTGLQSNTRYYFALKATDEMQNTSAMSNVVDAQTKEVIDNGNGEEEDYSNAPTTITDLKAANTSAFSTQLSWTVSSTAKQYDIRYSTSNITTANFNSASQVKNILLPSKGGSKQMILINELQPNQTFYFAIKTSDENGEVTGFSNTTSTTTKTLGAVSKLTLTPSMVTDESGFGNPRELVDEQSLAGDVLNSVGGVPVTTWMTGWGPNIKHPAHGYIDLGEAFEISQIFFYDGSNAGDLRISYGYPGNWTELLTDNLTGYLSWTQHNVKVYTRYLRISKMEAGSNVSEIVLYGKEAHSQTIDTTLPGAITDLEATHSTTSTEQLSWTAPEEDGNSGKADYYLLRYSAVPITSKNIKDAAMYHGMLAPANKGVKQSVLVKDLGDNVNYYFVLQGVDDNFNLGAVSNMAEGKTDLIVGGPHKKISLTPAMILNESVQGDATQLVDEQLLVGNPEEGDGEAPVNYWTMGGNPWLYPGFALIDLGTEYEISKIFLYNDGNKTTATPNEPINVSIGTPFNWTPLFSDEMNKPDQWSKHDYSNNPITTRYIRLEITAPATRMSEIVLYGAAQTPITETVPAPTKHELPAVDQFIGINAFIDDPNGNMEVAGFIREYHQWLWDEGNQDETYVGYPNNECAFNPGAVNWNFDRYYQNLLNAGITVSPSLLRSTFFMTDYEEWKLDEKPVRDGKDATDPMSYIEHADYMYQFAARFGHTKVADSNLKLRADQPRVSGLGVLKYFENWNEQDAWWMNRKAYFTPYEYAAMASADADGHMGALGPNKGIKAADPTAKVVMSGVAVPHLDHVRTLKFWSDYHRGGDFPLDVINVHHYCNDGEAQRSLGSVGISPEDDDLKGVMEKFVDYRDRYLPGVEVWITEFGYDSNSESIQGAPNIGPYDSEEVQGQWMIRSYLALAAAGVDKAAMYMLRDVAANSPYLFQTCGLMGPKGDWTPKPSWYYVYTMKNRFTGMAFEKEIPSGNPNVWIYQFRHKESGDVLYAVWSPTSDGTMVNNYSLQLNGESNAYLVEMKHGDKDGVVNQLPISNNKVNINVSERPVFVMAGNYNELPIRHTLDEKMTLNPSMVVNESGKGNAQLLVDEQEAAGFPDNKGGAPTTVWRTSTDGNVSYPAHAYIDLGEETDLTKFYIRDMDSKGDITISVGEPGDWTPLFSDHLESYNLWKGVVENVRTRYVRVTLESSESNISELVLYKKLF